MVLQRIAAVACPGARFDLLDLYEIRMWPGGPAILCKDETDFDEIRARTSYQIAWEQFAAPMVSFFEDDGAGGLLVMRVSALRGSEGGAAPHIAPDVVEV
jgi:hypothetical protein